MLKQRSLIVILGVILGVISFFSKGTLFIFALFLIIGYSIYRLVNPEEKKFLLVMFIIGFLVRVAAVLLQDGAALVLFPDSFMYKVENAVPKNDDYTNLIREKTRTFFKMGDSDYASARGYMYAAYARGQDNIVIRHYLGSVDRGYAWSGYLYVIGLFYYLFDYSPVAVKFINCILGALTATFIYLLSTNFNKTGARISHFFVSFFPTLILWSTTHLKDTSATFLSVVIVWATVKSLVTPRLRYFLWALFAVSLQFILTKRDLWFLSVAFIALVYLSFIFARSKRKILWAITFVSLCIFITGFHRPEAASFLRKKICKLIVIHHGHVGTAGISYKILDEEYYVNSDLLNTISFLDISKASIRGLYHFMLEPFPTKISNSAFLCAFLQMLVWYFLLPFMFTGILMSLSRDAKGALVVLLYLGLSTMSIALSSGNIGTLLRHRDYVSAFYLMFAGNGLAIFLKQPHKKETV